MSGALAAPPPGMAGGMMPSDPTAGAGADPDADSDNDVVVTIAKDGQGGYIVYAGDEPESGDGGDASDDDADAMGPAGAAPAPGGGAPSPQGQPADSIGAALKIAMDLMQADASSAGAPGDADSQFSGGFNSSKSPTPKGMMVGSQDQKY